MKKRVAFIVMLMTMASSQIAFADSGTVNATSLNVRQKPSLLSSITGSLSKNTVINTLAKEGDFYKISYKGKTGYVSSSYIKIVKKTIATTSVASTNTEKYGQITASSLNVRSGAGSTYPVTGVITLGSKVTMYGSLNGFYKIIYKGKTGYISSLYVKVTGVKTTATNSPSRGTLPVEQSTQYIKNGKQYDLDINLNSLVSYANTFLGTPYLWGGTLPAKLNASGKYLSGGFDCSGFVQYVYKHFGINLPRITMDQINIGASVNINNLACGDLVFFTTNLASPYEVSHVGIYIGNNKFIHCPKPGDVVKISQLTAYYKENFVIGKRIIK